MYGTQPSFTRLRFKASTGAVTHDFGAYLNTSKALHFQQV